MRCTLREFIADQRRVLCNDESCTRYGDKLKRTQDGGYSCTGTLDGLNYGVPGQGCIEGARSWTRGRD